MRLLAILIGVLAMFAGGGAASASTLTTEPSKHPYTVRLLSAVDTCKTRVTPSTTFTQFTSCNRGLAAPRSSSTAEVDIWRLVLDCLWLGWTPGRGDGGFDNDVVNGCLEDGGVL